jgi:hypothetical protein
VKPLAGGFKVIDSNGSEAVQGRCIVIDLEGCGPLNLCLRWSSSHSMRMEERRALRQRPAGGAIMKNAATLVAAGQAKDATSSVVGRCGGFV